MTWWKACAAHSRCDNVVTYRVWIMTSRPFTHSMHQDMVLVLQDIDQARIVEGDRLNPKEIKDLNRGRMFLKDLAAVIESPAVLTK